MNPVLRDLKKLWYSSNITLNDRTTTTKMFPTIKSSNAADEKGVLYYQKGR